ncbi:MAG: serine hydrolase domain-containing protein [Acidobacteriota bacterium]
MGLSAERLARLDGVMEQYVRQDRVAGIVTLILRRGKLAHQGVYGYLSKERGTPMRADAIFRIASQTKAITSVAVMILQEEGKLLIGDPVGKYLPEFQKTTVAEPQEGDGFRVVPARRPITIRDLLTHTAGISYGWGPAAEAYRFERVQGWFFADKDEEIGAVIQRLAQLPFDAQPGERWLYGFSTDILGRLVEVVSGQTLAEFFQDRIFEPLKMVDSHFFLPEEKLERLTPVYGINAEGKLYLVEKPEESPYFRGPRRCYSGGAGLLSTARDYARFLQALLNGGELEGARILSRKSVEMMTVNQVGDLYGAQGFGLGFWVTRDLGASGEPGSEGAFGWGGAYHTVYWVDPQEELVAVLMCQLLPATGSDLHGKFRSLVYQAVVD